MKTIIKRIIEIRKGKGISHDAMAVNLGISQAAYSKIEKEETKLSVERLFKIAEILEVEVAEVLGVSRKQYNQTNSEGGTGYLQETAIFHQENKETVKKLLESKDDMIKYLKEENSFLKGTVKVLKK